MQGRTCLITGATNGIGYETALGLAQMGASLILCGRDAQRLETAISRIKGATGNAAIIGYLSDFSDLRAVKDMARRIGAAHASIDVLINNAGGMRQYRSETKQGFETTWGVNHLAPFLLTADLLPLLRAGQSPRIVNVASTAQFGATIDFDDLQGAQNYGMWKAYKQSQLANVMFTLALARRLEGQGLDVNCVHPGVVATGFAAGISPLARVLAPIINLFLISAKSGAQTSIYAASSPEIKGMSGIYFDNKKPAPTDPAATDLAAQERLWHISEAQTGAKWSFDF